MAIVFHCEHCGKKIEAQDSAAGKWGKCPGCQNKIYIPAANADEDELKLAPIDEEAERKERELMAETYRLSQYILQQKEGSKGGSDDNIPQTVNITKLNDEELKKQIITYLKCMSQEDIDTSKKLEASIKAHGQQALKILDRIALSHMPERELEQISPSILSGIIRMLRAKLSQS